MDLCCPGVKFSQQMLCDGVNPARLAGGDRTGCLVVSPVQLEPSHTLLDTQNPKLVSRSHPKPTFTIFSPSSTNHKQLLTHFSTTS